MGRPTARWGHAAAVEHLLHEFPAVGIVGARQVGKATLAAMIASDPSFTRVAAHRIWTDLEPL